MGKEDLFTRHFENGLPSSYRDSEYPPECMCVAPLFFFCLPCGRMRLNPLLC